MIWKPNAAAWTMSLASCLMLNASAQEENPSTQSKRQKPAARSVDVKADRVMLHRASEIQGMKVRNNAQKDLGTIKDLVIDLRPGMVRYAALSYGGFLGLGDKLFAVPWDALQHHHDVNGGEPYFVLDIDEATLKRSPGFEDSEWPNFADPQFSGKFDTFYEKFRKPRDGRVGITVDSNRVSVAVDAKPKAGTVASDKAVDRIMLRASSIMKMAVRNDAPKELGNVHDLVIEVHPGTIRYAALSYGGFLGLGDKLFAVPWKAFQFRHDISEKESSLVLNIDEAHLRKATGFDQSKWPNFADPSIRNELDKYYELPVNSTNAAATGAIIREPKDR